MRTFHKITLLIMALVLVLSLVGCQAKKAGPVTIHILTQDQAGMKPAEAIKAATVGHRASTKAPAAH